MARGLPILTALLTLAAAPAALAQTPPASPLPASPPSAQPAPKPASLGVSIRGVRRAGGRSLAPLGSTLRIRGTLAPSAPGETVRVEVLRDGRRILSRTLPVRGPTGAFATALPAGRAGHYVVTATHDATQALGAASVTRRFSVRYPRVRAGSHGRGVRLLQSLLARRGYAVPRSGRFDSGTARAVLAFRKVNGMARRTSVASALFAKLVRGGGFRLRHPGAGRHVEVDLSRQVMALAVGGRVRRTYHVSSGKRSTPTVVGGFRFYRHSPGYNAKRMYFSVYFIRGYAVHGFSSVPTYAASHGCVRLPIPNARSIYRWIRNGNRIFVYR